MVTAESDGPGKGATFSVVLPGRIAEPSSVAAAVEARR
jgi:hypothetical protein